MIGSQPPRRPEDLTPEERSTLHRAHQWLRNASSALEALTATDPIRGRWAPTPAPDEALYGARADLRKAYLALARHHLQLFGWDEPPVEDAATGSALAGQPGEGDEPGSTPPGPG